MKYKKNTKIFKHYILKDYLGKGGFGRVYLVENDMGLFFALKILNKYIHMEKRGIEVVTKVRSNRLVALIDYGKTVHGEECILMEYVPRNLNEILKTSMVSEKSAVRYFKELLKGLKVLETNHIVHRDIKPSNLFVLEDIIKIGDFGTAKILTNTITHQSVVAGTCYYMSPEHFKQKSGYFMDRWSACIIFHHLLSNAYAFDGSTHSEIIGAIMYEKPNLSKIPENFIPFFEKCFQKEIPDRHEDLTDMIEHLNHVIDPINHPYDTGTATVSTQAITEPQENSDDANITRTAVNIRDLNISRPKSRKWSWGSAVGIGLILITTALTAWILYSSSHGPQEGFNLPFKTAPKNLPLEHPMANNAVTNKIHAPVAADNSHTMVRKSPAVVTPEERTSVFNIRPDNRPESFIKNRLYANEDNTVTDNATGLNWMQTEPKDPLTVQEVEGFIKTANAKTPDSSNPWRLPTVNELLSLMQPTKNKNGLYLDNAFKTPNAAYWSADTYSESLTWYVDFSFQVVDYNLNDSRYYVRLVRNVEKNRRPN
jgi:serine/threonine protein kinase